MKTWFPKGIPVLSGDELTRARELKKVECRLSIHEANEILLDQCGESVPIAEAAWTGEIEFAFEGERRVRKYANALDQLPKETAALRHIELTTTELNRWLQDKHSWVEYRFPATGQAVRPHAAVNEPLQRFAAQEVTILATIASHGFNPLALPKNPPGKAGVKADVRKALNTNKLFTGSKVFDKAWERLSANSGIVIID